MQLVPGGTPLYVYHETSGHLLRVDFRATSHNANEDGSYPTPYHQPDGRATPTEGSAKNR